MVSYIVRWGEGLVGRELWVRVRGDRGGYEGNQTQKGHQNVKKTPYFSLLHINAQFMFFARFLIDYFFIVSLERNDLYLTFRSKTSAVFYVFTVTISILLYMLTII